MVGVYLSAPKNLLQAMLLFFSGLLLVFLFQLVVVINTSSFVQVLVGFHLIIFALIPYCSQLGKIVKLKLILSQLR